jgi:hypothetical protein
VRGKVRFVVVGLIAAGCIAGCGPTVTFTPGGAGGAGGTTTSGETSSGETSGETTSGETSAEATTTTTGSNNTVTTSGVGGAQTSTTTSTTSGPTTITVSASGVGGGMPYCYTCSEAISGSGGPLCMQSQPIFDALYMCACQNNCPMECYNACNFGMGDPNCDQCIYNLCWVELDDCYNDF